MSVDNELKKHYYEDYDVQEIADGVYKINEFNLSTMFLIVGSERAVVIDCGTGVSDFLGCIRKITDKPLDLLITHAHVDHIGGRGQFESMALSEVDECLIKDVTVLYRKLYVLEMRLMGFKILKRKYVKIKKVKNEPIVKHLKGGDIIDLGGKTLTVFETPGHTKGSLVYRLNEQNILFTGDVVNPLCLMFLKHATTLEVMKSTVERVLNIENVDVMWASHLSAPIDRGVLERGIACIDKARSRGNRLLPWISIVSKEDFTIIHLANKRNNKKVKKCQ